MKTSLLFLLLAFVVALSAGQPLPENEIDLTEIGSQESLMSSSMIQSHKNLMFSTYSSPSSATSFRTLTGRP